MRLVCNTSLPSVASGPAHILFISFPNHSVVVKGGQLFSDKKSGENPKEGGSFAPWLRAMDDREMKITWQIIYQLGTKPFSLLILLPNASKYKLQQETLPVPRTYLSLRGSPAICHLKMEC